MTIKQEHAKFTPSVEQIVFADNYVLHAGNISKACQASNDPDRNHYYQNWRHIEGFEDWLGEYSKKQVLRRAGKWYLILEKYAEAGSFKHLERLMEIAKEFLPPTEEHIHLHAARTFIFRDFTPEEANADSSGNIYAPEDTSGNRIGEAV